MISDFILEHRWTESGLHQILKSALRKFNQSIMCRGIRVSGAEFGSFGHMRRGVKGARGQAVT